MTTKTAKNRTDLHPAQQELLTTIGRATGEAISEGTVGPFPATVLAEDYYSLGVFVADKLLLAGWQLYHAPSKTWIIPRGSTAPTTVPTPPTRQAKMPRGFSAAATRAPSRRRGR